MNETPVMRTDLKTSLSGRNTLPDMLPKWRLLPPLLLGVYAIVLLARFATRGKLYIASFEDDYFYYFVIAKNLVLHGISSFDGLRPTNGYQPLWQLINIALFWAFGDHRSFFVALVILVFLLVCGAYRALRQTQAVMGVSGGYGLACALLSITFMAAISRTGMEVSVTLLLLTLFWKRMAKCALEKQSATEAILSGVLASGVALGRLDALLVIALYGLLTVAHPASPRSKTLRSLVYFFIGLLPLAIYFIWNHATFGTYLPISGVAKNLKSSWHPSISTLISLLRPRAFNVLLTWPACLIGFLYALHRNEAPTEAGQAGLADLAGRRVQLCVLLHPVLFYAVLSFTSDWKIWSWYLYPLVPIAALLGPEALSHWKPLRSPSVVDRFTIAAACLSIVTLVPMAVANHTERQLYQQAVELEEFSRSHPGRYAMGGGTGVPGYVMTTTLVQLEGLMGDPAFLDRIRKKQPLVEALQELQVDYYATMLLKAHPPGPCYQLREPDMAGPRSPVMAGQLCSPVADFVDPGGDLLIFDVRYLTTASVTDPK